MISSWRKVIDAALAEPKRPLATAFLAGVQHWLSRLRSAWRNFRLARNIEEAMKTFLAVILSAVLAAPALAQPVDPLEEDIRRALPPPDRIEAMAPALDAALGAMLVIDVGPLLDAADPYQRHPGYGRPGRTLGELGRRDDPRFEERLHGSVHGAATEMARMMGAFERMAPALARVLREMEEAMESAMAE
jgi:hypothetical protein